jgi:hypothetical protein
MNKSCFVLIGAVVAMGSVSLYAGETMVTRTTTARTTGCDFRVDKCQTSVAQDPDYLRFRDYTTVPGTSTVSPELGNPACYRGSSVTFRDYAPPPLSVEDLLAQIREKLNKVNCPQVDFKFDETTGDITIHYIKTSCDCDCDWTINIRDVKPNDFIWKRSTDNYSNRLGQMERPKFHTASEKDADDIQSDLSQICTINAWQLNKD